MNKWRYHEMPTIFSLFFIVIARIVVNWQNHIYATWQKCVINSTYAHEHTNLGLQHINTQHFLVKTYPVPIAIKQPNFGTFKILYLQLVIIQNNTEKHILLLTIIAVLQVHCEWLLITILSTFKLIWVARSIPNLHWPLKMYMWIPVLLWEQMHIFFLHLLSIWCSFQSKSSCFGNEHLVWIRDKSNLE